MATLAEMIERYKTVERGECRDCGNRWWFDINDPGAESWVCTTCAKTHGKSSYEMASAMNAAKKEV